MAGNSTLPRICVLGSLNMDLVAYVPHHPAPGETLTSSSFAMCPGGKGANQAIACAKLSRPSPSSSSSPSTAPPGNDRHGDSVTAHVSMVGAVGADTYGDILLQNLASHGVDVGGVTASVGLETGVAMIIVDEPTGQNRIVLSPGANHDGMTVADFEAAIGPRLGRLDLLVMQLEVPLPTVLAALRLAAGRRLPVLLNPAPAPASRLPDHVYTGLANLVVNETEAAVLADVPPETLDTPAGCSEVAAWFVYKGVRVVIITLGARGVYYSTPAAEGLVPAERVDRVVDTTAAGDTFVGQYALEVVSNDAATFDVEAAVRKASAASAITVQRKGAAASIPWSDEVARR